MRLQVFGARRRKWRDSGIFKHGIGSSQRWIKHTSGVGVGREWDGSGGWAKRKIQCLGNGWSVVLSSIAGESGLGGSELRTQAGSWKLRGQMQPPRWSLWVAPRCLKATVASVPLHRVSKGKLTRDSPCR